MTEEKKNVRQYAQDARDSAQRVVDQTKDVLRQERSDLEKITIIAGVLLMGMIAGALFNAAGHAKKERRRRKAEKKATRRARKS